MKTIYWNWTSIAFVPALGSITGLWLILTPDASPDSFLDILSAPFGFVILSFSIFFGLVFWVNRQSRIARIASLARHYVRNNNIDEALRKIDELQVEGANKEAISLTYILSDRIK